MRTFTFMMVVLTVVGISGCATGRTNHVDSRDADAQAGPVQVEAGGSTRIRGNAWTR